jgi:hypothetical protein
MKKKFISDIAVAKFWIMPTLAKNKTTVFSLTPKPPMDIGSKVMAPIMGKNTKK